MHAMIVWKQWLLFNVVTLLSALTRTALTYRLKCTSFDDADNSIRYHVVYRAQLFHMQNYSNLQLAPIGTIPTLHDSPPEDCCLLKPDCAIL